MTALTAAGLLLAAWDSVRAAPQAQRHWTARNAALLHAFAPPGGTAGGPASVGAQQAELLRVYAEHFGERLDAVARCPRCSTEVELAVPVAELVASVPAPSCVQPLRVDGRTVHWRLPSGEDIADAAGCADPAEGALLLLERCVDDAGGADLAPLREQLADRIAAADPYADIEVELSCPECDAGWESWLDIGEFVLAQLGMRAAQLLAEVDELARAYGWSEAEILALTPLRRRAYLDLVRGG